MCIHILLEGGATVQGTVYGAPLAVHRMLRRLCLGWAGANYVPHTGKVVVLNHLHKKLRYNQAASILVGENCGGNAIVMEYSDWRNIKGGFGIE